jgi:hypothetical protein
MNQDFIEESSLRGRAASSARPGILIKDVLMGKTPLKDGCYVTEASITDLHNAYKQQVHYQNALRMEDGLQPLSGMNVYSFTTLFKFARYLGLVEYVRDEPRHEPSYGNLYRVENGTGLHIVPGTRRIFRLTEKGRQDDTSWMNLCGAWRANRAVQAGA